MKTNFEKKIKRKLINKNFKKWNEKSIKFLLKIFENNKNELYFDLLLILFDDYIKWCLNNEMESEKLIEIYLLIKKNIYFKKTENYSNIYLDEKYEKNDNFYNNFFYLTIGLIFLFIYSIIQYINSLINYKDNKYENRKIFELNIPVPENILNNDFLKNFLKEKIFN